MELRKRKCLFWFTVALVLVDAKAGTVLKNPVDPIACQDLILSTDQIGELNITDGEALNSALTEMRVTLDSLVNEPYSQQKMTHMTQINRALLELKVVGSSSSPVLHLSNDSITISTNNKIFRNLAFALFNANELINKSSAFKVIFEDLLRFSEKVVPEGLHLSYLYYNLVKTPEDVDRFYSAIHTQIQKIANDNERERYIDLVSEKFLDLNRGSETSEILKLGNPQSHFHKSRTLMARYLMKEDPQILWKEMGNLALQLETGVNSFFEANSRSQNFDIPLMQMKQYAELLHALTFCVKGNGKRNALYQDGWKLLKRVYNRATQINDRIHDLTKCHDKHLAAKLVDPSVILNPMFLIEAQQALKIPFPAEVE